MSIILGIRYGEGHMLFVATTMVNAAEPPKAQVQSTSSQQSGSVRAENIKSQHTGCLFCSSLIYKEGCTMGSPSSPGPLNFST